ncbi:Mrp/NBP35 family ATP-binding protein [Chachezhania antarctica]|uniref:Mrp/NBP35 family ATP-binding protein n=1 Tax=Chachezhania antarctica TaxID=2340860 RepID=UPI000EB138FE|nr:Mrp/NBP35 family ATP-binding protein [Chachezhania antarctica]
MSADTLRDRILEELKQVTDPVSGKDLIAADLVRALTVDGDTVRFVLEIAPDAAKKMEPVRAEAEARVAALPGVAKASVLLTAHSAKAPPDLKGKGAAQTPRQPAPAGPQRVPGVGRVIVVGSGKGGVGKSTVSANLAIALAAEGQRVGLLDADFYGPSQPRMMGVSRRPASADGKVIDPLQAHGVKMMSMGLMLDEAQSVVWRGPMLMSAVQQMMMQVAWGDLDVLVIDLPPGTGDVQLSLCQKFVIDGAVIVSTPQDVALLDARKAIDMFNRLNVPILGLVENMSTHICSNCGHEEHIFGHGGVSLEAEKMGVPLLGAVPLHLDIRLSGDGGTPVAATGGESTQVFSQIARALVAMADA